jgi:hypothetical protein
MERLYKILPSHVRENIERADRTVAPPSDSAPRAEPELVADEAFFDEIERFLERHWRHDEDEEGEDENQFLS